MKSFPKYKPGSEITIVPMTFNGKLNQWL